MPSTRPHRLAALTGLALFWLLVAAPPEALAAAGEPGGVAERSFLRWMAESTGPIGALMAVMSFYMIALVAWMFFEYRASVALPDRLLRELNDHLMNHRYTQAYERIADDPSFLARVLSAGVRKLPSGIPSAQHAMRLANDDVSMEMEHRTTYLATVGTLGPLIGLFGTVYGMIVAFRVMSAEGQPQASQLAGGISTALFATLMGIGVAIPAITFYAIFRNRIARISLEVELAAEALLDRFAPGVRSPHPIALGPTSSGPGRSALGGPPDAQT